MDFASNVSCENKNSKKKGKDTMINGIKLKIGSAPGQAPLDLAIAPVTVFVGPNNSGKSKVLQEINRFCRTGERHHNDLLLDGVNFDFPSETEIPDIVRKSKLQPRKTDSLPTGHVIIGKHNHRIQVSEARYTECLKNPMARITNYCQWHLALHTLILDGKDRITLVNEQNASDLQDHPQHVLDILFRDDACRMEVRRIAYDAFGVYFVIDPTSLGKFRIRYSAAPPADHIQERGIHEDAVKFHSKAMNIQEASDGVKAFTGIITQIVAGDPRVIIIDEPEAFLHPSLSFKLGKEIAVTAAAAAKRLFVSTHSANFIMGCIQSGASTNIIRLTYQNGIATARSLPNEKLLRLMRNPLLRSTRILEGLFYESVIVTESDSDRAFYQEINERLLRYDPNRGIPNCLFVNAQNKQTVRQIVQPLRELGIPAVGIVDVDILKEGGKVWTEFLECGSIPSISHSGLGQIRSQLLIKCEQSGKNMKTDGGIDILHSSDREAANNLFDDLQQYGLFIVRCGEVESWLKPLGAKGHGPIWLIDIFERMGEEPDKANYIKPEKGDVWDFIQTIGIWLKNAQRKGIQY